MNSKLEIIESFYVTDFYDNKKLVWAMHNIIVWKINAQNETILIGWLPATIFTVEVIDNIKWSLSWSIDMVQEGGCKNNECFISEGDVIIELSSSGWDDKKDRSRIKYNSLKIGEVYIFSLRNMDDGRYMLNSHPAWKSAMISEEDQKSPRLSKRYKELRKAYTEEIHLDADIKSGKIINSFLDLSPSEIKEIMDERKQ
jgi:hypothetical protein